MHFEIHLINLRSSIHLSVKEDSAEKVSFPAEFLYNIMSQKIAIPLLVLFLIAVTTSNNLLLAPPFPQTAFLGKRYQVNFQVYGLIKPTFSFKGLPTFFKGFPNGTIAGTPDLVGSYKITISYSDKTRNGSSEVIMAIATNDTTSAISNSPLQTTSDSIYIGLSETSWNYRAGEPIYIELNFLNAVDPIVVCFTNVPEGVVADNTTIQGSVSTIGLYTFLVTVGDSVGNRAQSYFALNIQPSQVSLTNSSGISTLIDLFDAPVKNAPYLIDNTALAISQNNAENSVKIAFNNLVNIKNNYTMAQNAAINTANTLVLAQQTQQSVQQSYINLQQNINDMQNYINDASSAIAAYNIRLSIAKTATQQQTSLILRFQQEYDAAAIQLQNYSLILNTSAINLAITSRQKSSQAINVSLLSANFTAAKNNFDQSANNLEVMKEILNLAKAELDYANLVANAAQLNRQLVQSDNDAATTAFKQADLNSQTAKSNIDSIKAYISQGQADFAAAKTSLGVAQFNLMQAENKLFVAQTAKATADKSLAIIIAQGNAELTISNSTYIFKGCNTYTYPSMSGTARIQGVVPNGFKTSGGHTLIWGECTKKSTVSIGDLIYYQGSLINDKINLWLVQRIS